MNVAPLLYGLHITIMVGLEDVGEYHHHYPSRAFRAKRHYAPRQGKVEGPPDYWTPVDNAVVYLKKSRRTTMSTTPKHVRDFIRFPSDCFASRNSSMVSSVMAASDCYKLGLTARRAERTYRRPRVYHLR